MLIAHAVNEFLTTYKLTPGHAINNIAQAVPDKPDKALTVNTIKDSFYTFSNERMKDFQVDIPY